MKPSPSLKKNIRNGQFSGAELLEQAAAECKDSDLKELFSGAARMIQNHRRQLDAVIQKIASKTHSAGGSL